jgi:hypothetical protein
MTLAISLHSAVSWNPETLPEERLLPVPQADLRTLLPGLPRGAISEITGPRSSGRTTLVHWLLAASTAAGEVSAVVDCNDSFDPASAEGAGADLGKLLWVQCGGRVDHAMKSADLILHGGGFGLVVLDLCDTPAVVLQRLPLSYWYRFQRAIAHTTTALVVAGSRPNVKSCAARQLEMEAGKAEWRGPASFSLLRGVRMRAGLRKPVRPGPVSLWAAALGG